ncbi:MAG: DNA translocase FtsK 4TM domain-containing protein, partial [Chloroflexales bacterium]|nr:DNA translocase FtsK 4TM domain-containing protein [Chloroflexales bacterium]
MATKGSNSKGGRSTATRASSVRSTRRGSRKQPAPFSLELRPEHQRELFALILITVAVGTLIFFATGIAGGIGAVYMLGVQQAFGYGALIVPLALGILGVAILVQERFRDTRLSGSNVFGTFLVLAALLALLEFRIGPRPSGAEPVGAGGGLVGWAMVNLLSAAVGRPVALLVTIVAALFGALLTFNITL